jgi:hypothetical protein
LATAMKSIGIHANTYRIMISYLFGFGDFSIPALIASLSGWL